jgi:hypothetical protein
MIANGNITQYKSMPRRCYHTNTDTPYEAPKRRREVLMPAVISAAFGNGIGVTVSDPALKTLAIGVAN